MPNDQPTPGPVPVYFSKKPLLAKKYGMNAKSKKMSGEKLKAQHQGYLKTLTSSYPDMDFPEELKDIKYMEALELLLSGVINYEQLKKAYAEKRLRVGTVSEIFGRSFGSIMEGYLQIKNLDPHRLPFFTYSWGEYGLQIIQRNAPIWEGCTRYSPIEKDTPCCLLLDKETSLPVDMRKWDPELIKAYFFEKYHESKDNSYGHHDYTDTPSFPKNKTLESISNSENAIRDLKSWRNINLSPSKKQIKKSMANFIEYQKKNGGMPDDGDIPVSSAALNGYAVLEHQPLIQTDYAALEMALVTAGGIVAEDEE